MNNFFLPRLAGDTGIGSQIFTKGQEVINFVKTLPEPFGLLNSLLIQNAGVNNLNGAYDYIMTIQDKPAYIKDSNPDLFILWYDNKWEIYDYILNINPIYISTENVLYPWNVSTWQSFNPIYNPVPIVTKVL
jgi:hypothetical protein